MRQRLLLCYVLGAQALAACGMSETIYRGTWEPATPGLSEVPSRLVVSALQVRSGDLELLRAAGAALIGWHSTSKGWALRAGSTGGTHFVPTEETTPTNSPLSGMVLCGSSQDEGHWTRIAVRASIRAAGISSPHLIPPESDIVVYRAAAGRTDCTVRRSSGTVVCGNDWRVVAPWAEADPDAGSCAP